MIYAGFVADLGFNSQLLLEGSLTGLFFVIGNICRTMAYRDGLGGPIAALLSTDSIY